MIESNGSNKIITTEDGSHSIFNESLNETYHSLHGAIQESNYVFIQSGLDHLREKGKTSIKVFEVGFGTGLNVLLSAIWAQEKEIRLEFDSIEAYPISDELVEKLNYPELLSNQHAKEYFRTLHVMDWEQKQHVNSWFDLTKIQSRIKDYPVEKGVYDIIYYDAFAPSKQPEMWELNKLDSVIQGLSEDGVFVTYCAQGQLKRNLKSLGLVVETLPGPPGKKEMVRARKL